MALPDWTEVRDSLTAAICHALPLQLRTINDERVAGIGLHIDSYYGSAGLYLLPESATRKLDPMFLDSIGDWPISTDWDGSEDHAVAFAVHWEPWDDWFRNHLDELTDSEKLEKAHHLLLAACEAMRATLSDAQFTTLRKTLDFKVIVADHDEPDERAVERYPHFLETGEIRCYGDD